MAGPLAPGSGCRRTTSNWELGELGSAQPSCVGTAGTQHGPPWSSSPPSAGQGQDSTAHTLGTPATS